MRASLVIGKCLIGMTLPSLFMTLLSVVQVAHAADSLRCGSKLVVQGDSRDKARRLCGDPSEVANTRLLRRPSVMHNGRLVYLGENFIEVQVETWTYNFGPNKLMQRLRFVDGILESIESLDYGYNAFDAAADNPRQQ